VSSLSAEPPNCNTSSLNYLPVKVNQVHSQFLLGSGSCASIISEKMFQQLKLDKSQIEETDCCMQTVGCVNINVIGKYNLHFQVEDVSLTHPFYVIDCPHSLGIVGVDFNVKYDGYVKPVKKVYKCILGRFQIQSMSCISDSLEPNTCTMLMSVMMVHESHNSKIDDSICQTNSVNQDCVKEEKYMSSDYTQSENNVELGWVRQASKMAFNHAHPVLQRQPTRRDRCESGIPRSHRGCGSGTLRQRTPYPNQDVSEKQPGCGNGIPPLPYRLLCEAFSSGKREDRSTCILGHCKMVV